MCVNSPHNVALFMEKFQSDVKLLLPYCYDAGGRATTSIALCFVSRLTLQDRSASQRADCTLFPPFQPSQHAFYFRLVPVGAQHDRLFVVEYYDRPEFREPTLVLDPHGWIKFEALLRLFFQQGYRYLMKLFPEHAVLVPCCSASCSATMVDADQRAMHSSSSSSLSPCAHSMSIPPTPP